MADWRFASPSRRKLKRGGSPLRLTLEPNPDIIKQAASRARRLRTAWRSCGTGRKENVRARRADGRRRAPPGVPDALRRRAKGGRPRPVVAGFALETCRRVAAAREKLGRKGLDLVVANGPESLGSDRARFDIVTRDRVIRLGVLAKREAAERVLGEIGVMLRSQH
ncbi:MAG: hypothetical protein HY748_17030 [Elusimicrobia bacterium]|nr:hypothetical protein [Elusimicrobiota bacterium]